MKLKKGDMVRSLHANIQTYIGKDAVKVERVIEVDGPEGDRVKIKGIDQEFWSNYLFKV